MGHGPARNTFHGRRMAAQPDTLPDDFQISVTNGSLRQRIIAEDAAAGNVRSPSVVNAIMQRQIIPRQCVTSPHIPSLQVAAELAWTMIWHEPTERPRGNGNGNVNLNENDRLRARSASWHVVVRLVSSLAPSHLLDGLGNAIFCAVTDKLLNSSTSSIRPSLTRSCPTTY